MAAPHEDDTAADARALRRSIVFNVVGYLLKAVPPLAHVAIGALYGANLYGALNLGAAVLLIVVRVCLLGLDKGLHWWIPRQPAAFARRGIRPVLAVVLTTSITFAVLLITAAAPLIAAWERSPVLATALRWMALGLVPMAVAEVLIAASLGRKRVEGLFVKDALVPMVLVALAFAFAWIVPPSGRAIALPLAYCLAQGLGLVGAVVAFRWAFAGVPPVHGDRSLPREMVRYALPMGAAEIANSALLRIDTLCLQLLGSTALVGVWGQIMNFGNALRAIRRSFDPVVLAIVSHTSTTHDITRLRAGISYATSLVMITQMPVYAAIVALAPFIFDWMGGDFRQGFVPVVIMSAFWAVNGVIGLHSLVVTGYGRSGLVFVNVLVALVAQAALLWLLIPPFRLVGAAFAVGLGTMVLNVLAFVQARQVVGEWTYDPRLGWLFLMMLLSALAMLVVWLAIAPFHPVAARVAGLLAFLATQAAVFLWFRRTGRLVQGGA